MKLQGYKDTINLIYLDVVAGNCNEAEESLTELTRGIDGTKYPQLLFLLNKAKAHIGLWERIEAEAILQPLVPESIRNKDSLPW